MKPNKRIGTEWMKTERRYCCPNYARALSQAWKQAARKASRAEGKRQCRSGD